MRKKKFIVKKKTGSMELNPTQEKRNFNIYYCLSILSIIGLIGEFIFYKRLNGFYIILAIAGLLEYFDNKKKKFYIKVEYDALYVFDGFREHVIDYKKLLDIKIQCGGEHGTRYYWIRIKFLTDDNQIKYISINYAKESIHFMSLLTDYSLLNKDEIYEFINFFKKNNEEYIEEDEYQEIRTEEENKEIVDILNGSVMNILNEDLDNVSFNLKTVSIVIGVMVVFFLIIVGFIFIMHKILKL